MRDGNYIYNIFHQFYVKAYDDSRRKWEYFLEPGVSSKFSSGTTSSCHGVIIHDDPERAFTHVYAAKRELIIKTYNIRFEMVHRRIERYDKTGYQISILRLKDGYAHNTTGPAVTRVTEGVNSVRYSSKDYYLSGYYLTDDTMELIDSRALTDEDVEALLFQLELSDHKRESPMMFGQYDVGAGIRSFLYHQLELKFGLVINTLL